MGAVAMQQHWKNLCLSICCLGDNTAHMYQWQTGQACLIVFMSSSSSYLWDVTRSRTYAGSSCPPGLAMTSLPPSARGAKISNTEGSKLTAVFSNTVVELDRSYSRTDQSIRLTRLVWLSMTPCTQEWIRNSQCCDPASIQKWREVLETPSIRDWAWHVAL